MTVVVPIVVGLTVGLAFLAVGAARARDEAVGAQSRLVTGCAATVAAVPAWFVTALQHSEIDVEPARAWPVAGATMLVGAVVLGATRPVLALLVGLSALVAVVVSSRRSRRSDQAVVTQDLERLVDALAAELAAGRSLGQAIDRMPAALGSVGTGLRRIRARRRGAPIQTVLDSWAAERTEPGPALVADALALAGSSGGSQVGALQGVGETLREHRALDREVAALGSQAHASAAVLVVIPVLFAALVGVVDRDIGHFMVATPAGWACLSSGLVLDLAGAWWMRRLMALSR